MRHRIALLLLMVCFLRSNGFASSMPPTPFVTTWKTDHPGSSNSTSITIPTFPGETYNYNVDWDNDGVFDQFGLTGSVTHDYGAPGTVTIRIDGTFPRIWFNGIGDGPKLLSINQWGSIAWTSMAEAFQGCVNLNITATDAPDLSGVTSLNRMFGNASAFNSDIHSWDVSSVTDMAYMFTQTAFDHELNDWDVGSVTNMREMFSYSPFNQDLSSWQVTNVTNMTLLFASTPFNQNIGSWDVSNVTSMSGMFSGTPFNQDISNWDVSHVTNMGNMFSSSAFNQDIGTWNTGAVTEMSGMFANAQDFNQDIGGWDVSMVFSTLGMFNGATAFDQNLGSWNVSGVIFMNDMFSGVTLSTANYDSLLIGWSALQLQSDVSFNGGNSQYCAGIDAHNVLTSVHGWTIADGGIDSVCALQDFVTTWKLNNALGITSILIPTYPGETYDYAVDWDNDYVFDTVGLTGDFFHEFGTDTVTIRIRGNFPRIYFDNTADAVKLLSVDQWGSGTWSSMANAFSGCSNLQIMAADSPDLSGATSLHEMFSGCTHLNSNISAWDVSQVTDLSGLFYEASSFDQPLGSWDVSNVTSMASMFMRAFDFDQEIGSWDVSQVTTMNSMFTETNEFDRDIGGWNTTNVTDMYAMFAGSVFNKEIGGWDVGNVTNMNGMFFNNYNFNRNIGEWDVSQVTDMAYMFYGATGFNQDVSDWDVSHVTSMYYLFKNATAFNQNLGNWDVSGVMSFDNMLNSAALSTANYDSLLIGWSALSLQSGMSFSAGDSRYCDGAIARQQIIDDFGWTINDGGQHCPTSWTGVVSDDWFNPGNWTNGVPHQDLGAIIPFIANEIFPVINQAGAMCSDIELKPGTHLTIQPTGMLTVGN